MSLNFTQICNKIDRACGTNSATYTVANKTIDINLAQDEVLVEALKNNGWNVDDFNNTDNPIIKTDLNAGQRSYSFILDGSGNRILDIYKVFVMDNSGVYQEIKLVDQHGSSSSLTMTDGQNTQGNVKEYDLTGNSIFLDLIPSYSKEDGLLVYINREMTYFQSTDTTKVSGVDPLCHDYLYLKPSYEYSRDKGLQNHETLFRDLQEAKKKVTTRYGSDGRQKNLVNRIVGLQQNNK